jgi:hypothetical protein
LTCWIKSLFGIRREGHLNPGVPNKQLWAIGMIVVQWGMAERIREQATYNLMGSDQKLIAEYKRLRNSRQKTERWKTLVEIKKQEPERARDLAFIARFESLNNQRDDVVHRMWGGGMQSETLGAPADVPTTDASLHRNPDEKIKTKSRDARRNLRWRLDFIGLRKIANEMAQLNNDILASWLPPSVPPGIFHIWAYENADGRLEIGVASASESDPHLRD